MADLYDMVTQLLRRHRRGRADGLVGMLTGMVKSMRLSRVCLATFVCVGLAQPVAAACDTLEAYGSHVGDPAFDSTPAYNAFLAGSTNALCLEAGAYYFLTKPNPIQKPVRITGSTVSKSALVKAYPTPDAIYGEGAVWLLGAEASGTVIEHLSVPVNPPTTHGSAIYLQSLLGSPVSYVTLNDINITYSAGATYDTGLLIDGTLANTAAQGVRALKLSNISVFSSLNYWSILCGNCIGTMGSGIWTNGSFYVMGQYTPTTSSVSVVLSNVIVGSEFAVDSTTGFTCASCQASWFSFMGGATNGSFFGFAPTVRNWGNNTHIYQ